MSIYLLRKPPIPWGDYGSILLSGMSSYRSVSDEPLQLERTGPFVPPISLPGFRDIVLTDAFKQQLEGSGLTGLAQRRVIKKRIVRLEWEKWDRTAEDPMKYPAGGEPENYILGRKHSPALAEAMGDLWEVCLQEHAKIERVPTGPHSRTVDTDVIVSGWDGTDWFLARGVGCIYVSETARAWLENTIPEWVAFAPARLRQMHPSAQKRPCHGEVEPAREETVSVRAGDARWSDGGTCRMGRIAIEPGESADHPCLCCGGVTRTVWGYVYDADGGAYAVYYTRWTQQRPDHRRKVPVRVPVEEQP